MSERPAIRFEDVHKTYRLYSGPREMTFDALGLNAMLPKGRQRQIKEFEALRGVSLTVGHGERWGLVGRNGAGKTTLLRLLTGNYAPTSGRVEVGGSVQALFSAGIGFHKEMTGLENVRGALAYNGLWGKGLERAVDDVVDFVELGEFIGHPLRTYSLGMEMRLQFATATAISPDILVIDEVLGAGDGYFSIKSARRVRALTESGCTLLLVSHSLQQVRSFCTKVAWIDRGRIVATGPTDEILERYEESFDDTGEDEAGVSPDQQLNASREERTRRHVLELPEVFNTPFVAERIRETEPVDETTESPETIRLMDTADVERWGNAPPVSIVSVGLDRGSEPVDRVHSGDPTAISLNLRVARPGSYALRYALYVHSSDGELVASSVSPADEFQADAGEERTWRLELPQMTLGHGDYAASFGIFDASGGDEPTPQSKIEYLSRPMALRIALTNDSDPPILHWPSAWSYGGGEPHPGRVSGVQ